MTWFSSHVMTIPVTGKKAPVPKARAGGIRSKNTCRSCPPKHKPFLFFYFIFYSKIAEKIHLTIHHLINRIQIQTQHSNDTPQSNKLIWRLQHWHKFPSMENLIAAAVATEKELDHESKLAGRGRSYTSIEDLLICQSFIGVSENAIVGTSQKGAVFFKSMYDLYLTKIDKLPLHQTGGFTLPRRNVTAIKDRFGNVARSVTKFFGIVKTTPMPSGQNPEMHLQMCVSFYKDRMKHNFVHLDCYHYLKDQAKWKAYSAGQDKHGFDNVERPLGKRSALKLQQLESVARKAVKCHPSVVTINDSASSESSVSVSSENDSSKMETFLQGVWDDSQKQEDAFRAKILKEMEKQTDLKLLDYLDGNERALQLAVYMAKYNYNSTTI
jgi:hypothetical protein